MITPSWFQPPDRLSGMACNTPILVGFSGGADSCALLYLLKAYADETGAKLYAAHVGHGIRGSEAIRDRDFCRSVAGRLGIEFFTESFDVPSMVKPGDSLEGVGRKVRYGWFAELMNRYGIPLLALAHHADDNLETVIFNLLRGSGSRGMCGILPSRKMDTVAGGLVIRPLIQASKAEILTFCCENGIEFVTDSTNGEDDCTRNIIRHKIIPELEKIRPDPQKTASRMTQAVSEDCMALDIIADNILGTRDFIEISLLNAQPAAIAKRIVALLCRKYVKELSHSNICSVLELARSARNGSCVTLPDGAYAVTEYGRLYVRLRQPSPDNFQVKLDPGFCPLGNGTAICLTANAKSPKEYGEFVQVSSADIKISEISGLLSATRRKAGDTVNTMNMTKSLKKLFCERRVPTELREILPIIRDGKGILLVPDCAVRTNAQADGNTDCDHLNISVYFDRGLLDRYNSIKKISEESPRTEPAEAFPPNFSKIL